MFVIYSKLSCPNCDTAKRICNVKGLDYKSVTIGIDVERDEAIEFLSKYTNQRTVPQILTVDSKGIYSYIGGLDEFRVYLNSIKK